HSAPATTLVFLCRTLHPAPASSLTLIPLHCLLFFFSNHTATTEIYTLSLHDALPILVVADDRADARRIAESGLTEHVRLNRLARSEEHTSELQSLRHLVCRLLLEKKKKTKEVHQRTQRSKRMLKHPQLKQHKP